MGWLIEAIANVCLELLGDLMTWTVNLVTGLSLDIGMDSIIQSDGTVKTQIPPIGSLVNPVAAHGNLLENTFPMASSFTHLFLVLGASIIMFIFLGKLAAGFGGPFVKSEPGGVVVIRTFLAAIGTAYSYSLFVLFESLFNGIYSRFLQVYIRITDGADSYALSPDNSGSRQEEAVQQFSTGGDTAQDAFNMMGIFNGKDLLEEYKWGQGLALAIVAIALFSILLISFAKLVLEIYERYVMLGVLYYVSPLAFATLADKEMNVCKNWVIMVLSEFVVMCSNLFFTGVFIAAWHTKLSTTNHALFQDPKDFITYMFLMIAWLIIGQQFDQHLKSAGLSTVQTGRSLGGAVITGAGTAALAMRTALGAARTATNMSKAAIKNSQASDPNYGAQQFIRSGDSHAKLSRNDANKALDMMQSGKDRAFNNYDNYKQGSKIMEAALASGGKGVADSILEQTGSTANNINHGSVSMDGQGFIRGETYDGKPFVLHNGNNNANTNGFVSKDLGSGWSAPLTRDQAKAHAELEAAKQPTSLPGYENVSWATSGSTFEKLVATDGEGNIAMEINTPHMIMADPNIDNKYYTPTTD